MKSNVLHAMDAGQIPLKLVRTSQALDPTLVIAQPTFLAAIKLCISLGGFEGDKQVYGALGIDASHWTRIHRGEAHFPVDKLLALMDLCGNEAPLIWLAQSRGYDPASLRKRETETERALRFANEALEAERVKVRVLTDALHGNVT
ncbi:hypothetical protein [Dyella mobilis]|uniref:XRE family transcriptional regulator n=1 Tax=Dyella mobilis TaxID=1849582 RepID=A0ABS2KK98_9GAMM|nr:hypothetical protein [Dyella mobilis]MBM7131583.1 hypothetical protein [Dyella mobilis]GLQ96444.1 hypothetical protein GCM10007863_08620 [Dyella mobilis]